MARLPIPGDDVGSWGGILNDFLSVELNSDGTLKKASIITGALQPGDNISKLVNDLGYTNSTGTVTSVAISGTDGIEIDSGSPITSSGIIQLGINATNLRTHLNIEDGADVTNSTNVSAAGATMNSDGDVSGNSWVLAEDDLISNSASKVPTQRSVKTYIDDAVVSGAPDATLSTKGKIRLAGDIGGTADVPTIPALSNRVIKTGDTMTGKLTLPSIQITGGSPVTDYVLMTDNVGNGTWKPVPSSPVISVNTKQGNVNLTKSDIGLSNVDNTSDTNKPISTATQSAIDNKEDKSNKGIAGGYASLDGGGTIPVSQLPNQSGSYIPITAKGVASGVAELDSSARLPTAQLPTSIPFSSLPTGTSGSNVMVGNDSRVTNAIQSSSLDTDNTLSANSDGKIATQKATKEYVDNQIATGTAPDATNSTKGIIKLSGDLAGTASTPTVTAASGIKSATSTVLTNSSTAPVSGQFLRANNNISASWQTMPRTFGWYINGDISNGDGQGPIYRLDENASIDGFDVNAKQPPASDAIFDVQITNDPSSGFTSIFTSPPTVATGQFVGTNGTLSVTSLSAGNYIRFCVSSPGGDGSGLNVAAGVTAQLRLRTR